MVQLCTYLATILYVSLSRANVPGTRYRVRTYKKVLKKDAKKREKYRGKGYLNNNEREKGKKFLLTNPKNKNAPHLLWLID
jgi:hypothetical protein